MINVDEYTFEFIRCGNPIFNKVNNFGCILGLEIYLHLNKPMWKYAVIGFDKILQIINLVEGIFFGFYFRNV